MAARRTSKSAKKKQQAKTYTHSDQDALMRPEVGTQAQFRKDKRKPPATYRYDSSLSPALDWDGQNPAREGGDALIRRILDASTLAAAKAAAEELERLGRPFLNWAGKAERLSFDVPTLPLFIHERLSTKAILETLARHRKDQQTDMFDLFGDPKHSITDQVLRAYEYKDQWVNRMILGDSLVVMNSLLHYEGMGGQVQMIYIDPPYGVKFGSNFQPFVKKRDVKHNDDADMTREPEMVQAYRDTWEIGLHSYLTYLRDRLLLARELLTPSGSVFVQISDENLHHVREVMDEVFGGENFCGQIAFKTTSSQTDELAATVADYVLWYSRSRSDVKFRRLFRSRDATEGMYEWVELSDGGIERLGDRSPTDLPVGARVFARDNLTSARPPGSFPFEFQGRVYTPGKSYWKTGANGLSKLAASNRLIVGGLGLYYRRYFNDFPYVALNNIWADTQLGGTYAGRETKVYAVQTPTKVISRCLLMTTDPGDLVLDPTCGSGTTAYVAEQWGRRWITIDTSRVPLALARQRLLTATFPWYELKDDARGPAGGFVYKRKQNAKGEEVGGIVPHVTLKSIANDEP
ncbi:MAG: site-specific DNA-methyltransferase, partial [Gemmatimonadota bacterium]|nr:site-specific DNA-methyltransferase [Gemmatimonadota bacterium]